MESVARRGISWEIFANIDHIVINGLSRGGPRVSQLSRHQSPFPSPADSPVLIPIYLSLFNAAASREFTIVRINRVIS